MSKPEWNHTPEVLPLPTNPLWAWPPRPVAVLRWYWDSWFPVSTGLILVGLSFAFLWWLSPTLSEAATPGWWIAEIFVRNLVLFVIITEGLHQYLCRAQLQGTDQKFDPRPYPRAGRVFTFDHQYWDNVFWSIASGVTFWSGYEALIWWAMANGHAGLWNWSDGAIWFIAIFFLIPVWESFYFYWIHRLLHSNLFYRFHALHHRNTDIGPWSGLSMHPVEHLLFFGTALIHFVVPTHPVHVICHMMFFAIYPVVTHAGHEGIWLGGKKRFHLGNFHHQIHHRYFEVNYGTLEVPWDKLFGTFHDGTDAGKKIAKSRIKERL